MTQIYNPAPYQVEAEKLIMIHKKFGLLLRMGLGKTAPTISAIHKLMFEYFRVGRVLVVAPKRVAENVWVDEAAKWEHLQHPPLRVGTCALPNMTAKKRLAILNKDWDICCIGVDNMKWLLENFDKCGRRYDMLVIDESSKFKNPSSQRTKYMKAMSRCFERVVDLTGSPATKGYMDLWSQIYLLDQGRRLETHISHFRNKYFNYNEYTHQYTMREGCDKLIEDKIKDITFGLNNDFVLKKPIVNDIWLHFDDKLKKLYDKFKKDSVLDLVNNFDVEDFAEELRPRYLRFKQLLISEGINTKPNLPDELQAEFAAFKRGIIARNAAALSGKLLQFASGAVYDENHNPISIHDLKMEALKDIIDDQQGENVLIAYNFEHELLRIKKAFPKAVQLKTAQEQKDWNVGKISILLCQPASVGHGLNIQQGGHTIVWFSPTFDLELYEQLNARLNRTGQTHTVIIHRLLVKGSRDCSAIESLANKDSAQRGLIASLGRDLDVKELM